MRAETLKGHLDGLLLASLAAERGTWREFSAAVTALLEPVPRPVTP